jgi:formyltetrahydrofolate deformylase
MDFVLTLSCPDKPGIVYAVSSFLVQHSANILSSEQYGEAPDARFFMRVHFTVPVATSVEALERDFSWVAESFHMDWKLRDRSSRVRTLIMVSRLGHCLNDLPFHHIPVTAATKADAETQLLSIVDNDRAELIVLARYMQILSAEVCKRVEGRMINIHHSFLPSFKGAKPYHQAHTRGVKLVGATAHYVTPDLDEGPIIEQDVIRVNHTLSPERLAEAGRDVEAQVLARAVTWHAEHRVLLNEDRTVVFH